MMKCALVLCLLLALAAAELVMTPFGLRPKECVHHVAEDEVASFDDADELFRIRRLVTKNKTQSYEITREYPRCPLPIRPRHSRMEPNGWAADASWLTDITFNEFGGEWNVPALPLLEAVQTLFLFTGFQNSEANDVTIIQPVLQWGSSEAGSMDNWAISSWFVSANHATYSDLVGPLQPGNTIVGNMTINSNNQWVITTTDMTAGKTTKLTVSTDVKEVDAFVTLEVYGISTCADYPNGQTTFSSLWLEAGGVAQVPTWQTSAQPGCDEAVRVVSPSEIVIKF